MSLKNILIFFIARCLLQNKYACFFLYKKHVYKRIMIEQNDNLIFKNKQRYA
ncbi:uncharacterized protein B0P05DRAFT_562132 [Gilbertella persicaria]|uniref:uncharacterized protein n=1 Tax=Gilbertella persicaria TaxID=101096 RepID=UPI00221E8E72|nr:uncharacterized protein B0P05DRAFT_562132 [Gilbertella persicaria]KAI8052602.1 hypothetical protein B0P05DRAFT_562132 [Gilbertella persicaria]